MVSFKGSTRVPLAPSRVPIGVSLDSFQGSIRIPLGFRLDFRNGDLGTLGPINEDRGLWSLGGLVGRINL